MFKQRRLNRKAEVLWLRLQKGRRNRRAFPLYNDREIFKCATRECQELLDKNLIEHKQDDDYDTDIDVVDDHVDLCLAELRDTIYTFIKGDALKLCRNLRGEFSGIQKIECNEPAGSDDEYTPDSSWYEIISIPTEKVDEEPVKSKE